MNSKQVSPMSQHAIHVLISSMTVVLDPIQVLIFQYEEEQPSIHSLRMLIQPGIHIAMAPEYINFSSL